VTRLHTIAPVTVRRSQRLNPELHTKKVIDALNAETERQRLERQERLQLRRQKRQQKEDAEVSDTESVASTETNTGKAHQDAWDQFDAYLSDLKLDIELLEKTAEKQYRLDVLKSAIDNYEDLASIGDTFNDDRQAHFEPKLRQYQQQIDEAESSDARAAAEKNLVTAHKGSGLGWWIMVAARVCARAYFFGSLISLVRLSLWFYYYLFG
jgi:hypothetical protein